MFGPIFVLKWYGKVLPCFEKEEDRNARLAVQAISDAHVLSLPVTKSPSLSVTAGFSLGGLFRTKTQSTGQDPAETSQHNSSNHGNNSNTIARLVLQDSLDEAAQPELVLEATTASSSLPILHNVQLRKIHTVMLEPSTGHVVLSGKKPSHGNKDANELLRLCVVVPPPKQQQQQQQDDNIDIIPATNDERNMLVHHLMVLIEWDRQRRATLGLDDDDDQDNFIQARAKKAAHFAKRELELQQTKRDRDKRKAQLVAQAGGGLKYTALAMANRNIE